MELIEAIRNENLYLVVSLLDGGADPNAEDHLGNTALAISCDYNKSKKSYLITRELIMRGANVNKISGNAGDTSLHLACRVRAGGSVKLLLEHGANVNARNVAGDTPLDVASEDGNVKIIKLLIRAGANVDSRNVIQSTPLFNACYEGKVHIAKLLIKYGADKYATNLYGNSPAFMSATMGRAGVMNVILRDGFDVNATRDSSGMTVLHMAAIIRRGNVIGVLLKGGADVNAVDHNGNTPLNMICCPVHSKNKDACNAAKILLDNGANIENISKINNMTPLHMACMRDDAKMANLLISRGANVMARIDNGDTPLHTTHDAAKPKTAKPKTVKTKH